MTDQEEPKPKPKRIQKPRKHNPAWKDATRNQRTQEREAAINAECLRLGFDSKSALLTALAKGEIEKIVRKKKNNVRLERRRHIRIALWTI